MFYYVLFSTREQMKDVRNAIAISEDYADATRAGIGLQRFLEKNAHLCGRVVSKTAEGVIQLLEPSVMRCRCGRMRRWVSIQSDSIPVSVPGIEHPVQYGTSEILACDACEPRVPAQLPSRLVFV